MVNLLNQGKFPLTIPLFQLLFTNDRLVDILARFKVDEPVNLLFLRETICCPLFVPEQSSDQLIRYTNIQCAVSFARHDVDEV